jgi:hypothetical protein
MSKISETGQGIGKKQKLASSPVMMSCDYEHIAGKAIQSSCWLASCRPLNWHGSQKHASHGQVSPTRDGWRKLWIVVYAMYAIVHPLQL